jgi:hypothetical protein
MFSDPTNQFRVYETEKLLSIIPSKCLFRRYDFFFWLPIAISRSKNALVAEFPVDRSYPADGTIPTKINRKKFPRLAVDLLKTGILWKRFLND